jgi:predicted glycoside hydrolase/deacetylase ChbG (UPF0249 family)
VIAIGLCADDYGQHAGIDDAVCALVAQGRLTAVSCMSEAPRWSAAAARLRELPGADIGLHLNLTERFVAPQAGLGALIATCYLRRLDPAALRATLARQCDAFEAAIGRAPDFIDGHQHVHQLPQVADALIELIDRRYGARPPWVRNTVPLAGLRGVKPTVLRALGGGSLARRLRTRAVPTNAGFGGVYGFDTPDYGEQVDRWLARARDGALLMCHPASATAAGDPISAQRLVEFAFLASPAFAAMLAARQVRLVRLSTILPGA